VRIFFLDHLDNAFYDKFMSTITFDTHRYVRKLTEAGVGEQQAEAMVEAIGASHVAAEVATKADLRELELRMESELKLLRWMTGATMALSTAILIRLLIK